MARILIIEDEPSIAENLRFALNRDGHETHLVALGADGLHFLRDAAVDLVILDVGLPDMTGFEVCRRLRGFSEVPVIFLTARGEEIDRVVGLEIGADDYVVKPFSLRELMARVQAILRRRALPASAPPSAVASAGLTLDEARAQVTYYDQVLELTRYEYLLIKLLQERPGRVFSRAQIMDAIWPATSGSGDRTVDAHIKTLRAKLKVIMPSAEPLKTHRGLGYSLSDTP